MPGPDWFTCFRSLEQELEPFFGPQELAPLLRRAGFNCGRASAGEDPVESMRERGLPLEACGAGFRMRGSGPPAAGLAAWCAGWLEGTQRGRRAVRVSAGEDGTVRLDWEDVSSAPDVEPDFRVPARGPLTPFQMAQLADLSADAVIFVDRDLRFRAWNQGAVSLFGYTAEEALGRYYDLLVPEDLRRSGELEQITRDTEEHGILRNYVTRRVTRAGDELIVSLTRTVVRNRHGETVGFGVILRDVTDEERMKEQLEGARRLAQVGELASQVAHEVRNPLASIHGALQILRRRLKPDAAEAEVFEDVAAEIMRLDQIVTDLLRFGRPAAPRKQRLDLAAWLEDWHARVSREAISRKAEIRLTVRDRPEVDLDPNLFEQVLRNLFENSLEASEGACRLHVEVGSGRRGVEIVVRDHGPGIPPECRAQVMEPFFTTKARGSGLGLAICRRHLDAHGGDLELLDVTPGAAFRIRLPAARPAPDRPPISPRS